MLPVKKMVFSVSGTSTVDIGPLRCLGQLLKYFTIRGTLFSQNIFHN